MDDHEIVDLYWQRDEHVQQTAEDDAALQLLSDRLAHNDEVQDLRVRDDAIVSPCRSR